MRLLDTETGHFVEKDPEEKGKDRKPQTIYAILSHTWDKEGEQTYAELKEIQKRYPPEAQPPPSRPASGEPESVTSTSSPEQVRDEPSPVLPPSKLQSESVSGTTPLITPSKHSKSWFARRIARSVKRLLQCRSARNIETDSRQASVPTPIDAPSPNNPPANDPHGVASNDPSAPSPGNSPPLQTTCLPTALGRFTESEVEALFRVFVEPELYDLPNPNPARAPAASSDPPAPSPEHQPPSPPRSVWDDPDLSPKIRDACRIAREHGYHYIWIDSCCINKTSSSELSEAINSMYKWYGLADVCFAYLADVPPGEDHRAEGSSFCTSRWFKRGWTLQELIAPGRVEFLAQDWAPIGSKHVLISLVESITKIHYNALLKLKPLDTFSVAQRLSWATNRETTREEDRAYSLLGIFGIHMPTLYGEGHLAFRRLQEQIMQRIPDQSLFAWGTVHLPDSQLPEPGKVTGMTALVTGQAVVQSRSLFVQSVHGFKNGEHIRHAQLPPSLHYEMKYTLTPLGIRTKFWMIPFTHDLLSSMFPPYSEVTKVHLFDDSYCLVILGCEHIQHPGHLLGRVCCTLPGSGSNFGFLRTTSVLFTPQERPEEATELPDSFLLSPEAIERCRPHIELKTVYIPHPQSDHTDPDPRLLWQPYNAIKLVLLTETCDALRSRGYSADLRDPDPDHPTTRWLTLSKDEHTMITVEFRHTLDDDGRWFTMDTEVKLSGSGRGVQPDSAPDSHQADHSHRHRSGTISRTDYIPWASLKMFQVVQLGSAGVGVLTVDLGLRFLGREFYGVVVDVRSDAPPSPPPDMDMPVVESALPAPSAVESATERGARREIIGDGSPSGVRAVNAEDEARAG